jgi:ATP/maltotriose-dependent transcriptional regulator MalT
MQAMPQLELALEAADEAGDVRTACNIRVELGYNWTEMGDPERAEGLIRRVLVDVKERSLATIEAFTLTNLGNILICLGRLDEAKSTLKRSLELADKQGSVWTTGLANFVFSTLAFVSGDFTESEHRARTAAENLRTSPGPRIGALSALARALLAQGRTAEAFDAALEAATLLETVSNTEFGESLVRLMNAETKMGIGDASGALVAIGAARDRLLERADKIADSGVRSSFLSRVADNARTLELARAWGCPQR